MAYMPCEPDALRLIGGAANRLENYGLRLDSLERKHLLLTYSLRFHTTAAVTAPPLVVWVTT